MERYAVTSLSSIPLSTASPFHCSEFSFSSHSSSLRKQHTLPSRPRLITCMYPVTCFWLHLYSLLHSIRTNRSITVPQTLPFADWYEAGPARLGCTSVCLHVCVLLFYFRDYKISLSRKIRIMPESSILVSEVCYGTQSLFQVCTVICRSTLSHPPTSIQ